MATTTTTTMPVSHTAPIEPQVSIDHRGDELTQLKLKIANLCSQPQNLLTDWEDFKNIHGLVEQMREQERALCGSDEDRCLLNCIYSSTPNSSFQNFEHWLSSNKLPLSKLGFVSFADVRGNGAIAKENIDQDSVFVTVPKKFMLSTETAQASSDLRMLLAIDEVAGSLLRQMPNVLLALHLLFEVKRGADSFWAPYIDILPRNFTLPLYYSLEEFEILRGSPALPEATKIYRSVVRQYVHLSGIVSMYETNRLAMLDEEKEAENKEKEDKQLKKAKGAADSEKKKNVQLPQLLISSKEFTFDCYRWAVSIVMTRQNQIPVAGNNTAPVFASALIPVWDMCNHEPHATETYYDTAKSSLECTAKRSFAKGEEVFINYGPRPNSQLLLYSGFVSPSNPFDCIKLTLGISKHDPLFQQKQLILSVLGFPESGTYSLYREKEKNSQLYAFCRVFCLDQPEAKIFAKKAQDILEKSKLESSHKSPKIANVSSINDARSMAASLRQQFLSIETPLNSENETRVQKFLQGRCNLLLSAYKTKDLLPENASDNSKVAFNLIQEEKELLKIYLH